MTPEMTENIDEARRRAVADSLHSFQQHMAKVTAEKDAELNPLPLNAKTDSDRDRWIRHIAAIRFCSYADGAVIFTAQVAPQLRAAIEKQRQAEEIQEEQTALADRIAAEKSDDVPALSLHLARSQQQAAARRAWLQAARERGRAGRIPPDSGDEAA